MFIKFNRMCRHVSHTEGCELCAMFVILEEKRMASSNQILRGICLHLGDKLSGPRQVPCQCRYECEAGEPFAVPSGNCQSCQKWESQ